MAVTTKLWTPLRSAALAFSLAGAFAACGDVDDPIAGADAAPPTSGDSLADGGVATDADVATADAGTPPGADAGADGDAGASDDGSGGDGASDAGLPGGDEPDACPS